MDNQQRNLIISEYKSGISANKISIKYNKNIGSIMYLLRKNNIHIRSISESVNLHYSNNTNRDKIIFNSNFEQFIIGLMCGDGSLRLTKKSLYPHYNHTDKHKTYLIYLKKIFQDYGIVCGNITKNKSNNTYRFQTETLKSYLEVYNKFYINSTRKKVENINITPIILYNWYIGDGNIKKNKDSKNISTEITCKYYCKNIESQFKTIFGSDCKYHFTSQKYYFPVKYRNMFLDYIGNCKDDDYQYKFIRNK